MKKFVWTAAIAAVIGVSPVSAEDAPTEHVGLSAETLAEIALAKEFEEVGDRRMRMRVITVEKGGVIALHEHKKRPSEEYVLSGAATEFRSDEERVLMPGDFISANHETVHWWRNDGEQPLVLLAVDIYEPN